MSRRFLDSQEIVNKIVSLFFFLHLTEVSMFISIKLLEAEFLLQGLQLPGNCSFSVAMFDYRFMSFRTSDNKKNESFTGFMSICFERVLGKWHILSWWLRHSNNKVIVWSPEEFHGLTQIDTRISLVMEESNSNIQHIEKLRYWKN